MLFQRTNEMPAKNRLAKLVLSDTQNKETLSFKGVINFRVNLLKHRLDIWFFWVS